MGQTTPLRVLDVLRLDSAEHDGVANAQSESVAAMGMERHEIDDRARADDVQRVDGLDFFRARGIDTSRRYYPTSAAVLVRLVQ
jgi:hypothetical protein